MKLAYTVVIAAALAGCSSAPTEQEVESADFGVSMSEAECLAIAKPFIRSRMGDPESVIFVDLK